MTHTHPPLTPPPPNPQTQTTTQGLLQSELAEILKRLPRSRAELAGVLASEKAQRAYKAALDGKEPEPEPEPEPKEEQLLGDVDECRECLGGSGLDLVCVLIL